MMGLDGPNIRRVSGSRLQSARVQPRPIYDPKPVVMQDAVGVEQGACWQLARPDSIVISDTPICPVGAVDCGGLLEARDDRVGGRSTLNMCQLPLKA